MEGDNQPALEERVKDLERIVRNQSARILALESTVVCVGRAMKRRYKISEPMAISLIQKATQGSPEGEALAEKAVPICRSYIAASQK